MQGLGGNDSYYVDNAGDIVTEAAAGGTDTVYTSVSYALLGGQEIENLRTTNAAGVGAINLTGNNLANTIVGNAGNNVIIGGAGADTMQGLGGNDSYYVDNGGDIVTEAAAGGTDTVYTSVSYALLGGQEIENLRTNNQAAVVAINLTGNNLANNIVGNAGNNVIFGGAGADTMQGLAATTPTMSTMVATSCLKRRGGTDTVFTSVSYTLLGGQEIENLRADNPAAVLRST